MAGPDPAGQDIQTQGQGIGSLLQRDYWAVIEEADRGPAGIIDALAHQFTDLAPDALVRFVRSEQEPLDVGDEMDVRIAAAGTFRVRVIHRSRQSLTLATLVGHPEAGRITFGAYCNQQGDVVFHIRSRARVSSRSRIAGFIVAGDPMQTNTWTDFINRVAATFGAGVIGAVHAGKRTVEAEPGDDAADRPTFIAEDA